MKKLFLPFFVIMVSLVSDTPFRAISATTSSPITVSPVRNITTRSFVQTGDNVRKAPNQARTLTFAERIAYQGAIEEVSWRHRIWPKENSKPKPALDAVMSQAQLEKKVTDYLQKSQALEDYWKQRITADQLQAEMDRMA